MKSLRVLSASEQVAEHLRQELMAHTWTDTMPGEAWLASELSIGRDTIKAALAHLERDGLLEPQGAGRRRKIISPKKKSTRGLQVKILLYEDDDGGSDYMIRLRNNLEKVGHRVSFAQKTLIDMRQNPTKVQSLVDASPAEAWIVQGGSQPVLTWFAESNIPAFALYGRMAGIPIAGAAPGKVDAMRVLAKRFVDLGHQKIVMLTREERRKPTIGPGEQVFLDELENQGISVGQYNIPNWDDNGEGFIECLDSLFRLTPPTALFLDTSLLFYAAQHYLARNPKLDIDKVSMFCSDYEAWFDWFHPSVACFQYDTKPIVRRITQWVDNVHRGVHDIRQTFTKVKIIEGETLKPVVADSV